MSNDDPLSDPSDIPTGWFDRQPNTLLSLIETRTAYIQSESQRVIEAYFLNEDQEFTPQFGLNYFQLFKLRARSAQLTLSDLECYAPQWAILLPDDPAIRAGVIHLVAQKYPLAQSYTPRIWAALGFDQQAVQEAYESAFGQPLTSLQGESPAVEDSSSEQDPCREWISLPSGAVLYREGETADAIYVVVSGRLRVAVAEQDGSERVIAELSRGEMVGEIGLFTGEPRSTTVYAIRDSELVKLQRPELNRLAARHPQMMMNITRMMADRLRVRVTGGGRATNTLMTFAIVPASPDAPWRDLAWRFAETLGHYGSTLYLDSERLDIRLGAGAAQISEEDTANSRLVNWLSEQEAQYRYVVYLADDRPSHWTRRCIRQADRVLIVADAEADPELGEVEAHMRGMRVAASSELVLLHPPATERPSGTRRWLEKRNAVGHYHVRLENAEDLERLTRQVTGHALSLVLGGGGARGFAHIGVIRALTEAGFQVDRVGGSSMGAVLGAIYAMGMDYEALMELAEEYAHPHKLLDLTLPLVSFFSSRKVSRVLREVFEDMQIEDLWRPYFCVSSNLTRATPVVHKRGPLWQAVRASSAIPGVFAPMLYEGDLLVDGAVLNNLPLDVMCDLSQGGTIVAVNVFPETDLVRDYQFGSSVSGWKVLLGKLNPFGEGVLAPSIFENLLRVIALNDVRQAREKRALADLYIAPAVEDYSILDFASYAEIAEIGYRTAQHDIELWGRAPAGSVTPAESKPATPLGELSRALAELDAMLDKLS